MFKHLESTLMYHYNLLIAIFNLIRVERKMIILWQSNNSILTNAVRKRWLHNLRGNLSL
jgi:hypothetical protein